MPCLSIFPRRAARALHHLQDRGALVLDEEHHELGRLRRARVAAHDVHVVRTFIEDLACLQRDGLAPAHLHHDRAFLHVDEAVRVMAMGLIRAARRISDPQDEALLPGEVAELLGENLLDVRLRRSGLRGRAAERAERERDNRDEGFHSSSDGLLDQVWRLFHVVDSLGHERLLERGWTTHVQCETCRSDPMGLRPHALALQRGSVC
jgi:hypothetical protein